MKPFGLVPIILLVAICIYCGLSSGGLTASQRVPSSAVVGETAVVTVILTYNGVNSTEAIVTPSLPLGIITDTPGSQNAALSPGLPLPISYPIRAERSGTYVIGSQIDYAEDGIWRNLRLESPFTAFEKAPRHMLDNEGQSLNFRSLPSRLDRILS